MWRWWTILNVVFVSHVGSSNAAPQFDTGVGFIQTGTSETGYVLKAETWPCELDIPELIVPHNRSVYSAAAAAIGTELYLCLTTLYGDGGLGVYFESFCYVGGPERAWISIPAMEMRNTFTMTAVGESIVVAGGIQGRFPGGGILSSVQVYKNGAWEQSTSLPMERFGHCAVAISEHELAVIGGQVGAFTMDFVDVLDLETGAWTSLLPLTSPRVHLGCSLWGGIYLMVSGGEEEGLLLDTVERLDTRQLDAWVLLPSIHEARSRHYMENIDGHPTVTKPLEILKAEGWEIGAMANFSDEAVAMTVLPCT